MEFIEESFKSLVEHCIHHGIDIKQDSFKLINSLSSPIDIKKSNVFLLGVFVNREKTPKTKIYREGRNYKAGENFFEVYFAMFLPDLEQYAKILRVLCDFEEDEEKNRYRLLNSENELKESTLIKYFLKLKDNKGVSMSANAIFVRVEKRVETLQALPDTVSVSDIKINMKRKKQ